MPELLPRIQEGLKLFEDSFRQLLALTAA